MTETTYGTVKVLSDTNYRIKHPDHPEGQSSTINRKEIEWQGEKTSIYAHVYSPTDREPRGNLLLIHGMSSKGATWKKMVKLLARMGFRAIAPDLPNHGSSGELKGVKRMNDYSEQVYQMVRDLGVEDCIVATSSSACFIGLAMANDHPEFVKGAYMSGAIHSVDDIPMGWVYKRFRKLVRHLPINPAKFVKNVQGYFRAKTPGERWANLKSGDYFLSREGFVDFMDATMRFKPRIPDGIPCALQFADKDNLSRIDEIRAKYRKISNGNGIQVYLVKSSGHHIQREAPYSFASNLWNFAETVGYIPEKNEDVDIILNHAKGQYRRLV